MNIKIPRLRTMLPKLKTFFGFQICNITDELLEVYKQQAQEGRINEELAKAHTFSQNPPSISMPATADESVEALHAA